MTWQIILAGIAVAASLITAAIHFAHRMPSLRRTHGAAALYLDPETRFSHRRER